MFLMIQERKHRLKKAAAEEEEEEEIQGREGVDRSSRLRGHLRAFSCR